MFDKTPKAGSSGQNIERTSEKQRTYKREIEQTKIQGKYEAQF